MLFRSKQYTKLKKDLEDARKEVENLEVEAADLVAEKAVAEQQQTRAKATGNKAQEERHKREAQKAERKLKEVQKKATNKKTSLKAIQEEIDKKIEEIKKEPGLAAHLEDAMKKRAERQYFQNKKKLEELTEKKEKLELIQKLATEHPSLANNLTGILVAAKQIKEYEAELESLVDDPNATPRTYTNPARAAEINNRLLKDARKKMQDNKEPFLKYCEKHDLKIDEKDIKDLLAGRIIEDPNGNIDLKTTLNARIGSVNRQLKSANKIMDNNALLNKKIQEEQTARNNNNDGGEQPKPWQIFKRFKNWLARRKQARLADEFNRDDDEEAPASTSTEEQQQEDPEREAAKSQFRDSLKYDIVRDAMNQTIKEKIAEARKEMEERHSEEQEKDTDAR